ncbi:MAG: phosphoglycerate kinase [Halobacteriales archaeon]|nr:phosphoglycerate kinase [Halobacteriales archaeon]
MPIRSLDDLEAGGRTLGVRVDINSPIEGGRLADDARLRAHVDTLAELTDRGGRVALLAHQGRPGEDDFASLESHAERLDQLLDAPVSYEDGTFCAGARAAVETLEDGDLVVLENTRYYSEEVLELSPVRASRTPIVSRLAPVFDAYVNDAFAAAHRSQPTLIGFPKAVPSYAGRVMERELEVLGGLDETDRPRVFFLGGAKVDDSISVARSVLERDLADEVLTAGLVGNVLLAADGVDLGGASRSAIADRDLRDAVDRAVGLLGRWGDRIHLPSDLAVDRRGERREMDIEDLPAGSDEPALDVGGGTIQTYSNMLEDASTVVLNGPAGVYERPSFAIGSELLYRAATEAGFSVVGGGDTAAAIRRFGITGFDHVSTGGGAMLRMLTGEPLPAVEVLRDAT